MVLAFSTNVSTEHSIFALIVTFALAKYNSVRLTAYKHFPIDNFIPLNFVDCYVKQHAAQWQAFLYSIFQLVWGCDSNCLTRTRMLCPWETWRNIWALTSDSKLTLLFSRSCNDCFLQVENYSNHVFYFNETGLNCVCQIRIPEWWFAVPVIEWWFAVPVVVYGQYAAFSTRPDDRLLSSTSTILVGSSLS